MADSFNLTARLVLDDANVDLTKFKSSLASQLKNISIPVRLGITKASLGKVDTLDAKLKSLNKTLQETFNLSNSATSSLKQLSTSASTLQTNTNNVAKSIDKSNKALKETKKTTREATTEMEAFGKSAAHAIRRYTAFVVATGVIYGLARAIKAGVVEAIKFEREMIKVSQVTGVSIENLGELTQEITRLGRTWGVSSSELVKVSRVLSQAGLSARETQVALEALAKSSLAPTFTDINKTTEGSIALMRQFKLGVNDLEAALGSINAVAGQFPVEADDIIAAIRRTGGVFAAASEGIDKPLVSLQKFIAMFTSIRATTRESAESIATGMRTITTRLQRARTVETLRDIGIE